MVQWYYPDIETLYVSVWYFCAEHTVHSWEDRCRQVGGWQVVARKQVVVFWLKCGLFLRSTNPMVL